MPRHSITPIAAVAAVAVTALLGCSASQPHGGSPLGLRARDEQTRSGFQAPAGEMPLAGARCRSSGGATGGARDGCTCRGGGDPAEQNPPEPGHKRFEIRMSADGGRAAFESEAMGRLSVSGGRERCFYVDLVSGGSGGFRFSAVADQQNDGVAPVFTLTEYGPTGPFWYDVLRVTCPGPSGRCTREGAADWQESLKARQRGRLDPCGSAVVTHLAWDTSGGQAERDGGLLRDFTVSFAMEVKAFATRFAPGATECVPK